MPNGCTWKVNLKFCVIQFPNKTLKRFKIRTFLNLPIRFYTTQHTDWFHCSHYFMDTFKAKTDNFSASLSLITYMLKTRHTSESYMDFNMWDQHQNLSPKKCGMGSLELLQPNLLLRAGPITAGSSGLCPVGFCISPRVENLQHLWATCSTLTVNIFLLICSQNFLYSYYIYSCNSLAPVILSSTLWWDGIALWHLTPAENPVFLSELLTVLILHFLYVCLS